MARGGTRQQHGRSNGQQHGVAMVGTDSAAWTSTPSRYIKGVGIPGLQILKTSALDDMNDSDHSPVQTERVSGNPAARALPEWGSFLSLVPGIHDPRGPWEELPVVVRSSCTVVTFRAGPCGNLPPSF
ncbi:hypothetical protein R1sor_019735 [Riccia sorocarpa]|uniref:Uncharacterized protein n=1 Tax=Riccia sorocarpa TaxID=122646 RepID=A0ABD3IDC7_9MARC